VAPTVGDAGAVDLMLPSGEQPLQRPHATGVTGWRRSGTTDSGRRNGTSSFRCCRTRLAWAQKSGESFRSATTCGIEPSTKARLDVDDRLVSDLIGACHVSCSS
jgi:hypothetical protein